MNMNKYYITKLKFIFIFRDQFLLTKAHCTGTVVFCIGKDNRWIYGIDDGTEVINCIQWLRTKGGDTSLADYLNHGNLKVGDSVSVMGQLEYFNGEVQLNVQKFNVYKSLDDVHKFYHHVISNQERWFDPYSKAEPNPYYRALSYISLDSPDILDMLIDLNKKHEDFVTPKLAIELTDSEIQKSA